MKRLTLSILVAAPALLSPSVSRGADHYDMFENPKGALGAATAQEDRHYDIVDLFTFPSTDGSGKLVMIMNTHNRAHPGSVFSDVIHHSFRVRTGKVRGEGNEYRFTCTFSGLDSGAGGDTQKGTCTTYRVEGGKATPIEGGATVVKVGQTDGGSNGQLRAFTGLRADAFFGDAVGLGAMVATHQWPFGAGQVVPAKFRNLTYNTNDLSIVLEVDTKKLLGESGPIFRVAAETAKKKSK
jgi:hypothetical protein